MRVGYVGPGLVGKRSSFRSVYVHLYGDDLRAVRRIDGDALWLEAELPDWGVSDADGGDVSVELASFSTNLFEHSRFPDYLDSLDAVVFVADTRRVRHAQNLYCFGRVLQLRHNMGDSSPRVFVHVNVRAESTQEEVDSVVKSLMDVFECPYTCVDLGSDDAATFRVLDEAVRSFVAAS